VCSSDLRKRDDRPVLYVKWSRREKAHVYGGVSKQSGGMLAHFFEGIAWPDDKNLVRELEARGYDITTLRFSIRKGPRT
jgi:hypothetical protein